MTGNITPITREEILWAKVLGENVPDIVPVIRKEIFLAKIAGAEIQTPKPITREEMYLDAIANGTELKLKPITRKEMFYAKALGLTDSAPEPVTRLEQILDQVEPSGGGTGGGGGSYDKYSWEGVFASIKAGTYATDYAIGDTVPLDLGTEGVVNMQIVAFDTDVKKDGSGNAPITWISKDLLASRSLTSESSLSSCNAPSEIKTFLGETLKSLMPAEVSGAIVRVDKRFKSHSSTLTEINAGFEVWLPSLRELNVQSSDIESTGPVYSEAFTTDESRIKCQDGSPKNYWTRTIKAKNLWLYVNENGQSKNTSAAPNNVRGIAFGFCT